MYSSVGPLSPGPPLLCDVIPVYINTNEIPGELSACKLDIFTCENNMLSSVAMAT